MAAGLVAGSVALVAADRRPEERAAGEARARRRAVARARAGGGAGAGRVAQRRGARGGAGARLLPRPPAAELAAETALPVLAGATVLKGVRLARRRPAARELAVLGAGALRGRALDGGGAGARPRRAEPPAGCGRPTGSRSPGAVASDRGVRHNGRR